ncbi:MAG: magnesium chelatase subunit H [Anaerolineae bacterium]|nr:magnesium chelatase subunit H [Anaerolineae bacterium]MDW8069670.1 magnesium chelatase subunit H [Anaerolineae bacterium]
MSLPRITLISSAAPLAALSEAIAQLEARHGRLFDLRVYLTVHIQEERVDPQEVLEAMRTSRAVLFDLRGDPDKAVALVRQGFALTAEQNVAFIPVFGGGPSVMALLRMGNFSMARMAQQRRSAAPAGVNYRRIKQVTELVEKIGSLLPVGALRHARNWVRCVQYWSNSGADNLRELLLFVAAEYAGVKVRAAPPIIYPDDGFQDWQSGKRYATLSAYLRNHPINPQRPTVLVILFGGTTHDACLTGARELLEHLSPHVNLLLFFADGIWTARALHRHLLSDGKPVLPIDAIISLQWFRLEGGPLGGDPEITLDFLRRVDAPFYGAVTSYNRTVSAWAANPDGVTPVEVLASVTLPELDGAIDPIFVFGLDDHIGHLGVTTSTWPAPGLGKRLAGRVLRRVALRRKPNAAKKLAFVLYDYPPGESNLGSASFLDVFASTEVILRRLKEEGYVVELPDRPLHELFLQRGLVHHGQWINPALTAQHAIRLKGDDYLRLYERLPHSLRQRVEEVFGPPPGDIMTDGGDLLLAAVRLGNVLVGLQPSRGVHENPERLTHDRTLPPHHQYIAFYRYIDEIFGADAVIHVGTHGTLEFTPGKEVALADDDAPHTLLGDVPHVYIYHVVNASEAMIAKRRAYGQLVTYASPSFAPAELYGEYLELEDLLAEYESQRRDNPGRAAMILEDIRTRASALHLPTDLDALHSALQSYRRAAIPVGLHCFGDRLEGDALADYLALVARYDRAEAPSLNRLLAQARGWDYDTLLEQGAPSLRDLDAEARALIGQWLKGDTPPFFENEGRPVVQYLSWVRDRIRESDELGGLLHALNGRYLLPNLAGDPIRSPETFPTGRNAYQFDPTKVPTDSALRRGWQIAEESLRQYYAQTGSYPETVGVVLWGFETCKTYGETIGQILGYLGVTVDRGAGYYIQPRPIPLTELGRPRVDVVVTICGFFRDLFPNQVRMLDLAFRSVVEMEEDESQNAVRRHTRAILAAGGDARLAARRIFGPLPGEYGTHLTTMIEHGQWKDERELVQIYLQNMQYAYGDNLHGAPAQSHFRQMLNQVELVTQVRDSHEFDVTDLDHYYEFFGGLARSAQELRGGRPLRVLIADTTGERIEVRDLPDAVRRSIATRLLNPKWIDGMLQHPFHGAQKIADRVEYLIGLSALTRSVDSSLWSRVAECLVFDPEMRRRLLQNNPYAAAEIARRLSEAVHRGYWEASDQELQHLREAYLEMERWLEKS